MKSFIAVALSFALLSSASPLGDRRVLSRKHIGAPLARRFILSSRLDAPPACAALNSTISSIPDNSTVIPSLVPDNSTVADNSTTNAGTTANANATIPADNSTITDNSTVTKRYDLSSDNFVDAWFDLCSNSGGDVFSDDSDPCFDYGLDGYSALFADADVCAQQEIADSMISFAKSSHVKNSADIIQMAISYRKMPRQSEMLFGFYPSTPYCTIAPINGELSGIWNEQPEGVSAGLFGGPNYPIMPFGESGSCQVSDVTTCSCIDSFYGNNTDGIIDPNTANSTITADATSTDSADMATATDSDDTTSDSTDASATDAAGAADATDGTDDTAATSAAATTAAAVASPTIFADSDG